MKNTHILSMLASAVLAINAHAHSENQAIGEPGSAAKVSRTLVVTMTDNMRFSPSSISVKQGETIKFIVKNAGQIKHEMVLGSVAELKEHAELMKKFPEMEHADKNMATVAAGKSSVIIWRFTHAGVINFACLQPGHYDSGMKGIVNVSSAQTSP